MNAQWISALSQAVHEVFENLCFMMPAAGGAPPPSAHGALAPRIIIAVDFSGARSGVLQLVLPDAMIAPVASAMMGDDSPLPLGEQYDAICELANVVCGNVLPLIAGERAVFDLAPPRVIATIETEGTPFDAAVDVQLDEGVVSASIALEAQAEAVAG